MPRDESAEQAWIDRQVAAAPSLSPERQREVAELLERQVQRQREEDAVEDGRREVREFHEKADQTDDVHDHDELHAAGTILASDPVWAETEPYVKRWLQGLRELHGIEPSA